MELTAAAAWLNASFAEMDLSIAVAVHKLYELAPWFFSPFFEAISFIGNGGVCLIIAALVLMVFPKTRRFGTGMLLGLAIGALFTNLWLKVVIARPRPYTDLDSVFYQIWLTVGQHVESDLSFPSGHTTAAFASMTPLFLMCNKRFSWLAILFAVLMGISRIYLGVHFASDVLGGIIVGVIAGCLGTLIANLIPRKFYTLGKKK